MLGDINANVGEEKMVSIVGRVPSVILFLFIYIYI